ncbi:MAG TPA: universal stress protein [Gemmatimonadales bacterium]
MLHTIVVPLDGSRFAEQALEPAHRIAHRLNAVLELAHVHEPPVSVYASGAPVLDSRLDVDLVANARAYLDLVAERERLRAKVQVNATLLEGPVVEALADHAARLDGASIVMTTHGRGGLGRALLGSVADGVVRSSSVPVLTIKARKDAEPGTAAGEFSRVLVPLAGTDFGAEIIDLAVAIAGSERVEYTLLHVLAPPPVMPPPEPVLEWLHDLAAPLRARGIEVSTEVTFEASAARAILKLVEERGIGMVAMTTHGDRGVKRLLLGSVADKVLRSVPAPVLLVRPPEAGGAEAPGAAGQANVTR